MAGEKKEAKAVALRYNINEDSAPIVTAKGKGRLAEKIIELAEENKVKMHKDETLADLLFQLEVMQQIPEEMYPVVAEVFAFIYRMDRKRRN